MKTQPDTPGRLPKRRRIFALAALLVSLVLSSPIQAEDLSNRWQLGGGISFMSTTDSIRSNAAFVLFEQPGPDLIANSGDEPIKFKDPRRDSLVEREATVDEDFRLDLLVAYGIRPWLSVQLDVSYFETDIIQFDTFKLERRYIDNGDGLLIYDPFCGCVTEERFSVQSQPFNPATIRQIPFTLSGVFRFWSDGELNLYLTAGVGYMLVDLEETARFRELNRIVAEERMLSLSTQQLPLTTDHSQGATPADGDLAELYVVGSTSFRLPTPDPITIQAEDSAQYTLGVGVDYFFNSHWALDFEVRYLQVQEDIRIDVSGYDQLNYAYVSPEDLPDCSSSQFPDSFFPAGFNRNTMGRPGICAPTAAFGLIDEILVQGGKINLSGFTFKAGLRYAF